MTGGTPKNFLERLYSCQDTVFIYHGIKYWFQGYMPDDESVRMEIFQYQPPEEGYIWFCEGKSIEECLEAFQSADIFENLCFWDAEQEIQWVDE